jgi:hypothetical protein
MRKIASLTSGSFAARRASRRLKIGDLAVARPEMFRREDPGDIGLYRVGDPIKPFAREADVFRLAVPSDCAGMGEWEEQRERAAV